MTGSLLVLQQPVFTMRAPVASFGYLIVCIVLLQYPGVSLFQKAALTRQAAAGPSDIPGRPGTEEDKRIFQGIQPNSSSYPGYVSSCFADHGPRICSCHPICSSLYSCCYDSTYVVTDTTATIPAPTDRSVRCSQRLNFKWVLRYPSLLSAECPVDWKDEGIREKCLNISADDIDGNIPCYSEVTGLTYRNLYCLLCNGLSTYRRWKTFFECGLPLKFEHVDSVKKMLAAAKKPVERRGCQMVVDAPEGTEVLPCNYGVDRCLLSNSSEVLQKACQSYLNPVISPEGDVYRNEICMRCSTNSTGTTPNKSGTLAKLSVLLNVTSGGQTQRHLPNSEDCNGNGVQNHCQPTATIARVKGYREYFNISVATTPPKPEANRTAITAILRQTFVLIVKQLKSLADFSHTPTKMGLDIGPHLSLLVSITINEDIPIQNIKFARSAIEKVGFTFTFDETVNVTCCYILGSNSLKTTEAQTKISTNRSKENIRISSKGCVPISNIDCVVLFVVLGFQLSKLF